MPNQSEPRYFLDIRSGIMAIRDSFFTDPDRQGLSSDDEGVVKHWTNPNWGKRVLGEPCCTCGHRLEKPVDGWPKDIEEQAKLFLDIYNSEEDKHKDLTVEQIQSKIDQLNKLLGDMVGSLYPSIAYTELFVWKTRLKRKQISK